MCPDRLIADKGYNYARCRQALRQRHTPHTILQRRDQAIYVRRNVVECCINWLKQWRGLAARYDKRALNYRAMAVLASIVIWLDS